MAKKILLIGMLNSVHFANWLERIQYIDHEIYLYPSRQYERIHPKIAEMQRNNKSIHIITLIPVLKLSVYIEYLFDTRWFQWLNIFSRESRLKRLLKKGSFSKIHALEIQHAAYLLCEALPKERSYNNLIITNWGSDIYFYGKFESHAEKIRKCLALANFYSAECRRDYELARQFGFQGVELPLVPNSTTFLESHFNQEFMVPSQRHQIIMKCYGGTFGYGEMLLSIANDLLLSQKSLSVFAYSVTEELIDQAEYLKKVYVERFNYTTVKSPVSHEEILHEFARSRVYIGASKSDGISTSFLEALASGAFPIQTSTSCAKEWVDSGAHAGIVHPNKSAIQNKLYEVIQDFSLLEKAQKRNLAIAKNRLSYESISEITKTFYS